MYRAGGCADGDRAAVRTTGRRRRSSPPAGDCAWCACSPSMAYARGQLAWNAISSPANTARPITQRSSISRTPLSLVITSDRVMGQFLIHLQFGIDCHTNSLRLALKP
ncbi:hypothetical protein BDA96_01G126900 [Sorghum bicolor]|uniref:Uncharacterized protein n=2 Tax=Sorghum bicolor TaxID=4558 RepID=A0A921RZD9_SORBI|nr:hypothetical protein BDA96_01G126900 [Sorghum bicolor]KXG37755.1 hypothetical protein SORBI_3001G121400 [Sorghum bicolor]